MPTSRMVSVCFADILAIGAMHAAHQLGIRVPEQLSIAGFGNDETSRFISPAITTMAQPSFEMGGNGRPGTAGGDRLLRGSP